MKRISSVFLIVIVVSNLSWGREVAPPWTQPQLELRNELRNLVIESIQETGGLPPEAFAGDGGLDLATACLAEYWLSGDPSVYAALERASLTVEDPGASFPADVVYTAPGNTRLQARLRTVLANLGGGLAPGGTPQPWYDWEHHHLRSVCLGPEGMTRGSHCGADAPGNLRFLRLGLATWIATGDGNTEDWCREYAAEWVRDIRASNWVAPSEVTVPAHEFGGLSGRWYRLAADPERSWERSGLVHAEAVSSLIDAGAAFHNPDLSGAVSHQAEVMWNAGEGKKPPLFFGNDGWTRRQGDADADLVSRNDAVFALQMLRLARLTGDGSFRDRIVAWAESVPGNRPEDPLIFLAAFEVSGEDTWLARSLQSALASLRQAESRPDPALEAAVAAQILAGVVNGSPGLGGGRMPRMEMFFSDEEGNSGLPPGVAAVTERDGNRIRCRFYNLGPDTTAVTLTPPFEEQSFQDIRTQTMRAKILDRPGRGLTVRLIPGYESRVIAEFPQPEDWTTWSPPVPGLPQSATASLGVLITPGDKESARAEIRQWFLERARELDRARWSEWESLHGKREREKYRASLRSRLRRSIGGLPARTPLEPRRIGELEQEGYTIEKWVIESRPGFPVPVNLYLPEGAESPVPAVAVFCGHEPEGKAAPDYQAVCIDLVREGYAVAIHDPLGQGERGRYYDPSTGNEHYHAGNQCYLIGSNLAQYMIWDAVRVIDFLASRSEVDPDRIACTGSSGGGALTQYTAALDARVRAAVPVCYPADTVSLLEAVGPEDVHQHPENVLAGELVHGIDQFGQTLLVCPRPMLMNAAMEDYIPIEATRVLYRRLAAAYEAEGATDAVRLFEGASGHGYSRRQREETVRFLNRWLRGEEDGFESTFAETDAADAEALACFPGEESIPGDETVRSLVEQRAGEVAPPKPAFEDQQDVEAYQEVTRQKIRLTLGLSEEKARAGTVEPRGGFQLEDAVVQRFVIRGEDGVPVPVLVIYHPKRRAGSPAVICLGDQGKPGTEGEDMSVPIRFVKEGWAVLAVDPRGMGETRLNDSPDYFSWKKGTEAELAYRSFEIGEPIFGRRVSDVLTAVDFICSGSEDCGQDVIVFGQGHGALLALAAAAVDDRVSAAVASAPLMSYRSILEESEYSVNVSAFIPGLLRDLDLPEVVAAIAPRPVLMLNVVDAGVRFASKEELEETYRIASEVHRRTGGTILYRSAGMEEIPGLVTGWLRARLADE